MTIFSETIFSKRDVIRGNLTKEDILWNALYSYNYGMAENILKKGSINMSYSTGNNTFLSAIYIASVDEPYSRAICTFPEIAYDLINLLLLYGADPNKPLFNSGDETMFYYLVSNMPIRCFPKMEPILGLLVQYGAKPGLRIYISADYGDKNSIRAIEIYNKRFTTFSEILSHDIYTRAGYRRDTQPPIYKLAHEASRDILPKIASFLLYGQRRRRSRTRRRHISRRKSF